MTSKAKARLGVVVLLALFVAGGLFLTQRASPSESPLKGTVKSLEGKPMEGVAVSARADGSTVTTTVYTERDGSYYLPPLAPPMQVGRYRVWAQAVGFDAGRAEAALDSGKTAEQNFTLKPLEDFSRQLTGVEWMASLPENTLQDRRAKRMIGINCIQCHAMGFVLQNQFDAAGWAAILNFMEQASHTAISSATINPFMHGYKEEIVAYLARVRGPASARTYKPFPRGTGESNQIVITEYDVSPGHLAGYVVSQSGSNWTLGTPSRHESGSTHDLVWDAVGGYVWFGDNITPERTIGKLDPVTGRVTDYNLLSKKGVPVNVHDLMVDPRGNVWITNGADGSIDKFDPRSEKFQQFPRPESLSHSLYQLGRFIDLDSNGNLWQGVQGGRIVKTDPKWGIRVQATDPTRPGGAMRFNPQTGEYAFYKALTPGITTYGTVVDAEDNVWFTRSGSDLLGVVDGRTGKVSEISLSAPDQDDIAHTDLDKELALKFAPIDQYGPLWQKGPRRQASDKSTGTHWIVLSKSSKLAKIDIQTRKVTEYPLPYPYSFPYAVAVDKNHMVWVVTINTDRIHKFDPFTEQFTDYRLPSLGTDVRFVSVDNTTDPPTIWVPYYQTNKIARIQFRKAAVGRAAMQ